MNPVFKAKVLTAKAAGAISRRTGRGGGTTLPGRMLLRLAPDAIRRLGRNLEGGSLLISASNGKTTTAAMIASALAVAGRKPVHNRAGSNMSWGVATALLDQDGSEGLFEVDEAWLRKVAADLEPRTIVLGNLFRDQLDRYGELQTLADEWAKLADERGAATGFVLNADDPLIADLGRDADNRPRPEITYFGIDDNSQAVDGHLHTHDAKRCRRCGSEYVYERSFVGHLGQYHCTECSSRRPEPQVSASSIELLGMAGSRVTVKTPAGSLELLLPLPGLYNVYNALAAIAAGIALGLTSDEIVRGLESAEAVFGRVETIQIPDHDHDLEGSNDLSRSLSILLIKNPVGANEVLRTLQLEAGDDRSGGIDLWIALNDRIADGRDISWIWDADFEILAGQVARITCAGTRAAELALRLKYAGVDPDRIVVVPAIDTSLDAAMGAVPAGGRLFALPTYTALLELRTLLSRRGLVKEYWA